MTTLEDIAEQLKILGLPTGSIPSLDKVKKAVRDNYLKKHPDKAAQQAGTDEAGQADNAAFVEVNEAARIVYGFLAENHNVVEDSTDDEKILSILKGSDKLKYNKDSITLHLDPSWGDELIELIEKRLGPREPLSERGKSTNNPGVIMSCSDLKIPWISDKSYGSVTVTVWITTKQNRPKLLVQGRAYFSFVCLALPYIMRDIGKVRQGIENFSSSQVYEPSVQSVIQSNDETDPSTTLPTPTSSGGPAHPPPKPPLPPQLPPSTPTSCVCANLIASFHKLESSIVEMRREFVDKLASVHIIVSDLQTNLANSVEAKVSAKCNQQFQLVHSKVDKLASQAPVNKDIQTFNNELSGVRELVSSVQKDQTATLTKLTLVEETVKEAVKSLKMGKTPDVSTKLEEEKLPEVIPNKRKKGAIFSSSLGKHTDIEKISKNYNCDFTFFNTYYVERNESAQEPDKNLVEVLQDKMSSDVDLVILQVGSNELSDLDLTNPPTTLYSKVFGKLRTDRYAADGLHLTKKGTQLLNQNWMAKVCDILPELVISDVDAENRSELEKKSSSPKKSSENISVETGYSGRTRTHSGASDTARRSRDRNDRGGQRGGPGGGWSDGGRRVGWADQRPGGWQ